MGRRRNLRGGSTTAYYYDASDDEAEAAIEEVADDEDDEEDGIEWRPTSRNGATVPFYCCEDDDVRWTDKATWEAERAICQNCGYDWTGYIE